VLPEPECREDRIVPAAGGESLAAEGKTMILCTLQQPPDASAAVAYAVWLGDQLHSPVRVCAVRPTEDLLAAAEAHEARLLVAASDESRNGALELVHRSPLPVIALSPPAAARWQVPQRASAR
jgi:hypothetical protein